MTFMKHVAHDAAVLAAAAGVAVAALAFAQAVAGAAIYVGAWAMG